MKVLVIGGAGHVGTLVLPYLVQEHSLRVLDRRSPELPGVEFVSADLQDTTALSEALHGQDALLYMMSM